MSRNWLDCGWIVKGSELLHRYLIYLQGKNENTVMVSQMPGPDWTPRLYTFPDFSSV